MEPFLEKKKARKEELKKNEGAILKFVKIATAKETDQRLATTVNRHPKL